MTIFGHQSQRESLKRLFFSGHLPSSMIFSGVAGIGKLLVARELSRSLFCEKLSGAAGAADGPALPYGGCGSCRSCRLFDCGNYPDFHLVDALDREKWNTAGVRELLYSLNLRSFGGLNRVVIIDNCEHLSLQACNALLKTLEEPGSGTYFILISANYSRLLPTVLSRCQIWHFDTLELEDVRSALLEKIQAGEPEAQVLKGTSLEEVALLADGSLANIDSILKDLDYWHTISTTLEGVYSGDLEAGFSLARELGKDRDTLRSRLNLIRIFARKKMFESSSRDEQSRWSVFLYNVLTAERLVLERNISAGYALNAAMLDLVSGAPLNSFTRLTNSGSLLEKIVV